jgi:hypothetical protein
MRLHHVTSSNSASHITVSQDLFVLFTLVKDVLCTWTVFDRDPQRGSSRPIAKSQRRPCFGKDWNSVLVFFWLRRS